MIRTYVLAGTPILISAILCLGFYQTQDLGFIHAAIVVLGITVLLFLFGIVHLILTRRQKSRSQLWLELVLLLFVLPICLLFVKISNNILNKEYITLVNNTGDTIELLAIGCNSQTFRFESLEAEDSVTIGLYPDMDKELSVEITSTVSGNNYQNKMLLKRKTNGLFSPSVISLNDTFGLENLNGTRANIRMSKRYTVLNNQIAPSSYRPETIEQHRSHLKYIKTNGGLMAYLDLGEKTAPPILLVHGVPTSSWLYRHVAQLLVEKGYRVIAPDLLGFGSSDKPPYLDLYHPTEQADRLIALMDSLDIPSWTHLMHDAGGLWSGELFLKTPERVDKIIFLNTIAYKEGFAPPMTFEYGQPMGKLFVGLYNYSVTAKMMMDATLYGGIQSELKVLSDEDRKGYWLSMTEGTDQAIYQFFTSFDYAFERLPAYNNFYRNSGKPAMIIWGMLDDALVGSSQIPMIVKDMEIPPQHVHQLAEGIHFIQEERPEELAGYIDAFLK